MRFYYFEHITNYSVNLALGPVKLTKKLNFFKHPKNDLLHPSLKASKYYCFKIE